MDAPAISQLGIAPVMVILEPLKTAVKFVTEFAPDTTFSMIAPIELIVASCIIVLVGSDRICMVAVAFSHVGIDATLVNTAYIVVPLNPAKTFTAKLNGPLAFTNLFIVTEFAVLPEMFPSI